MEAQNDEDEMNENNAPVEISTRMRSGEWTAESLPELVASYQQKLREMGATDNEIVTAVTTPDDGSASVHVSWARVGVSTFAGLDERRSDVAEAENARGGGESIPQGEPTKDSKGLGAIFGDAERSAIDEPASSRPMDAGELVPDLLITTDEHGNTHVEDAGPAKR